MDNDDCGTNKLFAVSVYFNGGDDEDILPRCYVADAHDEVEAEKMVISEIDYDFQWIVAEEIDFTGTDGVHAFTV